MKAKDGKRGYEGGTEGKEVGRKGREESIGITNGKEDWKCIEIKRKRVRNRYNVA